MTTQKDPAAFFSELLGHWETFKGSEGMKAIDMARAVTGAAGSAASAQAGIQQFLDQARSAANVPGRDEMEALTVRISRIEAALFRIESMLAEQAGASSPPPPSPDA